MAAASKPNLRARKRPLFSTYHVKLITIHSTLGFLEESPQISENLSRVTAAHYGERPSDTLKRRLHNLRKGLIFAAHMMFRWAQAELANSSP